ncbi:hypothetical protein CA237_03635 [Sphingomonas sp. ABOLH]|nr:hypothetical protein CA237_03635 [Sphingomonas sp. ABOLH]
MGASGSLTGYGGGVSERTGSRSTKASAPAPHQSWVLPPHRGDRLRQSRRPARRARRPGRSPRRCDPSRSRPTGRC